MAFDDGNSKSYLTWVAPGKSISPFEIIRYHTELGKRAIKKLLLGKKQMVKSPNWGKQSQLCGGKKPIPWKNFIDLSEDAGTTP